MHFLAAPYLIANAYHDEAPPVLVACVRNPVDQAISWWKYENSAISWGESIGLKEWNTDLRSREFKNALETIGTALAFSRSNFVKELYSNAEKLGEASQPRRSLFKLLTKGIERLPSWAITWPAGQMGTFGRSGRYFDNIARYNKVFTAAFSRNQNSALDIGSSNEGDCKQGVTTSKGGRSVSQHKMGYVHIIPLESQSSSQSLNSALRPVLEQCFQRRKFSHSFAVNCVGGAIARHNSSVPSPGMRNGGTAQRNASVALSDPKKEPNRQDIALLQKCFEKETAWYSQFQQC